VTIWFILSHFRLILPSSFGRKFEGEIYEKWMNHEKQVFCCSNALKDSFSTLSNETFKWDQISHFSSTNFYNCLCCTTFIWDTSLKNGNQNYRCIVPLYFNEIFFHFRKELSRPKFQACAAESSSVLDAEHINLNCAFVYLRTKFRQGIFGRFRLLESFFIDVAPGHFQNCK